MSISFKRLQIENFLSIGEGTLDLHERGLVLVQGENEDDSSANSNGAGKSSCVDALCWALFGTTARGQEGDKVVNRFAGKNCMVSIDLEVDGKPYNVTRYRKHSKGKNRLQFTQDGTDLTLGTDKLTQEAVEALLGCSLEVFVASIYAGQERMPNLPAMTDKELKLLVESAAGTQVLDRAYSIARERYKVGETAHATCMNRLDDLIRQLERWRQTHENAVKQHKAWEDERPGLIAKLKAELIELTGKAKAIKLEMDDTDWVAIQGEIDAIEGKIAAIAAPPPMPTPPTPPELPGLPPEDRALVQARLTARDLERDIAAVVEKAQRIKRGIEQIANKVGTPCGECGKEYCEEDLEGQKVRETARLRTLAEDIRAKRLQLSEVTTAIADAEDKHREAVERVEQQRDKLKQQHSEATESYQNALRARRSSDSSAESAKLLAALREAQQQLGKKATLRAQLEAAVAAAQRQKALLDQTVAEANPHEDAIASHAKDLARAEAEVKEQRQKVDESTAKLRDLEVVVTMFSPKGIRGEVLDSVTPFLNSRTGHYLGALSDGNIVATWSTVGETGKGELREKFHIGVVNANGSDDFAGLSGGEQRKVRIATAMALQDLVASRADRPIKLFIADEVDDSLDVSGLERLMGILEDKARAVGTTLIISHNDIGDWVRNQITVMKKGGMSHIIEV